ncbi:MAG: hypothetical protein QNL98_15200 [Mycobacterium sp.]
MAGRRGGSVPAATAVLRSSQVASAATAVRAGCSAVPAVLVVPVAPAR